MFSTSPTVDSGYTINHHSGEPTEKDARLSPPPWLSDQSMMDESALLLSKSTDDEQLDAKDALKTNEWQTFVNITKSIVGAGSFALPYCFKNMGVVNGTATVVFMGICSVYTTLMLLRCKKQVEAALNRFDLTYVDVARQTYGNILAVVVYGLMLLASMGVAASYLVFIGGQMYLVDDALTRLGWQAISLAVIIPVSLLRSFKYLAFTSLIGTTSLCAALIVTIIYGFVYRLESLKTFPLPAFNWENYFNSFGSVAFLFCIQFLVIPIERAMAKPDNFWRPVSLSIFFITVFNVIFAVLGYKFFEDETCDIILSNMCDETALTAIVRVTVCVDLLFTYPLVFAPGREIVENYLVTDQSSWKETKRNIVRLVLVMVTFGFAQIKSFGIITNIVGIPMSVLAFVLPPVMDAKLNGLSSLAWYQKIIYVLLIVGGTAACVVTTYFSFAVTVPECVRQCD